MTYVYAFSMAKIVAKWLSYKMKCIQILKLLVLCCALITTGVSEKWRAVFYALLVSRSTFIFQFV